MIQTVAELPKRFAVANDQSRILMWVMILLTVFMFATVPLTWFHGNITSRSTGSAIYFFVFSYGFLCFAWVPALFFSFRNAGHVSKNYVEVSRDGIEIALSTQQTKHIRRSELVGVRSLGEPRSEGDRTTEGVALDLRLPWHKAYRYGLGRTSTVQLRADDAAGLISAVHLMLDRASDS